MCGRGARPLRVAAAYRPYQRPAPGPARFSRAVDGTFVSFSRVTTCDEARTVVDGNIADLVAAGRPAIANPDLVTR